MGGLLHILLVIAVIVVVVNIIQGRRRVSLQDSSTPTG